MATRDTAPDDQLTQPPDRYAVVGFPIDHSHSPLIHRLFARQTGENVAYTRLAAGPEEFSRAVRRFAADGGRGLNVTVPHKEAAFELADEIGPGSRARPAPSIRCRSAMTGGSAATIRTASVSVAILNATTDLNCAGNACWCLEPAAPPGEFLPHCRAPGSVSLCWPIAPSSGQRNLLASLERADKLLRVPAADIGQLSALRCGRQRHLRWVYTPQLCRSRRTAWAPKHSPTTSFYRSTTHAVRRLGRPARRRQGGPGLGHAGGGRPRSLSPSGAAFDRIPPRC